MKTIWVNGTFDLIHYGHTKLLQYAHSLGDLLIVGIDSDERVSKKKGEGRPLQNIEQRMFNLQSIIFVDEVVVFSSDKELEGFIKYIAPDVMVIGDEYKDKNIIGSQYAKEVCFFDMPRITSSSLIIKQWKS